MIKSKKFPYLSFLFFWICLCIFSFTQKDPNLTIYNYPIIKNIIEQIVQFGQNQKLLSSLIFSLLIVAIFINYLVISFQKKYYDKKLLKVTIILILVFSLFAYPFLSHDLFNYLFNARMLLVYAKNPHVHTALEFSFDPWTRFMHNTHTAAPYGYLFTLFSLIPVFLGFGNFTLSLWLIKLFIASFFIGAAYLLYKIAQENNQPSLKPLYLFILNPLFLIETFINGHNDSLMIFFVFLSIYFYISSKNSFKKIFISSSFFIISVLIKYATIAVLPVFLIAQKFKKINPFTFSAIALFLILFTRIGQTHAWYLLWSFSFILLSPHKTLINLAILLSLGGLIRYIPYINNHQFYPSQNYLLLFLPLILLLPMKYLSKNEK